MKSRREPVSVLIAALGGQGGGVLTDWIVQAARADGSIVQATSIPGVSQRTGATTYYVEIGPPMGDPAPVLGLAPIPGRVDVLVCAELLEAARMLERGMSTPSRTTVIASTHRVYTTREKTSGADARFDSARIVEAVGALARRAVLFDMEALRLRHGSAISAALFGALAGSEALPLGRTACEVAIREAGRGVAASLAAFREAYDRARGSIPAPPPQQAADDAVERAPALPPRIARGVAALPDAVAAIARLGAIELVAYQGVAYAAQYLDRVARIVIAEQRAYGEAGAVTRETARHLALWMRYDDAIRVAAAKVRASRLAGIRRDAAAGADAIVRVHDFFKPGALELAAILPRRLGAWVERRALAKRGRARLDGPAARGVLLQTTSIAGMLALRLTAALRSLRPYSLRYAREQQAIEQWLAAIEQALAGGDRLAADAAATLAQLPRLIRGYGDTHASGRANFERLLASYRAERTVDAANGVAALRTGALSDPGCASRASASVDCGVR
jgi:indolepyruvate ferredoxin oxidoreductase beta subunit